MGRTIPIAMHDRLHRLHRLVTNQKCHTAGLFFFIAAFLVWCDKKFAGANYNNEQFQCKGAPSLSNVLPFAGG